MVVSDSNYWDIGPIIPKPETGFPRVSTEAFIGVIIATLVVGVCCAAYRTYFRLVFFRRLYLDDYFLFLSVACLIVADCLAIWYQKGLWYQAYLMLDMIKPPPDQLDKSWDFMIIVRTIQVLAFGALCFVKISYLCFFRKLIGPVKALQIWWWIALAICVPAGLVGTFLPFYVCPATKLQDYTAWCGRNQVPVRGSTYLRVNVGVDIATDVLVISVPLLLLAKVNITWQRKLALASILCLSIFMIVVAAVRLGLMATYGLPGSAWAVFWTCTEGGVAVIMVSVTSFRGIFGQQKRRKRELDRAECDESPRNGTPAAQVDEPHRGRPMGIWSFIAAEAERVMSRTDRSAGRQRQGRSRSFWRSTGATSKIGNTSLFGAPDRGCGRAAGERHYRSTSNGYGQLDPRDEPESSQSSGENHSVRHKRSSLTYVEDPRRHSGDRKSGAWDEERAMPAADHDHVGRGPWGKEDFEALTEDKDQDSGLELAEGVGVAVSSEDEPPSVSPPEPAALAAPRQGRGRSGPPTRRDVLETRAAQ